MKHNKRFIFFVAELKISIKCQNHCFFCR